MSGFLQDIKDKWNDKEIERMERETQRKKKYYEARKGLFEVESALDGLRPLGQELQNTGQQIRKGGNSLLSGLASFGEYSQKVSENLNQSMFGISPEKKKENKK